ncbi:MAG: ATP-binding protein, partial [Haliea sp.]|nr:ATP-binding protein [Haliea sp.]
REDRLRHDQILAVASLAAGTAHELGTPLGTMTLLVDELQQDNTLGDQARDDIALLQQQLLQCRKILAELSNTAELSAAGSRQSREADQLTQICVEHWAARRPRVSCQVEIIGEGPAPKVSYDQTLPQALENLLNNAADTGAERVEVTVTWDAATVSIGVRDDGPGAPATVLARMSAAAAPVPDSGPRQVGSGRAGPEQSAEPGSNSGLGIGLILARATVERHGGYIRLENPPGGGCLATLAIPVQRTDG